MNKKELTISDKLDIIAMQPMTIETMKFICEIDKEVNLKNYKLKKYKIVLNKIKEYVENLLKEEFEITDPDNINYGEKCQRAYFSDSELIKILELLEEIE